MVISFNVERLTMRTIRSTAAALMLAASLLASGVSAQAVELTARGSGPYIVYVNGVEESRHTTEREAVQSVTEALAADPTATVYYRHDYTVDAALEGMPAPPPPAPDSTPTDTVADLPPAPAAGHPNQPAGFNEILNVDGTAVDIPELVENAGWVQYVESITDPTSPSGTGRVLRGTITAGRAAFGIAEALPGTLAGEPARDFYLSYWLRYDPNYETKGHKLCYLGIGGNKSAMYLTREPDGRVQFINQNVESTIIARTAAGVMTYGAWHHVELHLVAESAAGSGDGRAEMWFDGASVPTASNIQWAFPGAADGFNGLDLWMQSNDPNTRQDYVDIGEFFISGR